MCILFFKKNLKKSTKSLLIAISFFCTVGCGPDKEAIILEKVAERVEVFRAKKNAECRQALLSDAEQIVDSLLLEEAMMELSDSLARSRPGRPSKPAFLPPIDSLPVKPLFQQSSEKQGGK